MDEWIRHLTGQQALDYSAHAQRLVTTKSLEWKHEKEWRIIEFGRPDDNRLRLYDQFWPEEIESVSFGCRSDPKEVELIVAAIPPEMAHVEVFVATKRDWQYGLDFRRIK